MIRLNNIDVRFKSKKGVVRAVNNVSLSVEKGDIYGIVGFSGAGKSTLIRTVNLLQRPTAGEVIIQGQNIMTLTPSELREKRKKIGMIFQHFNLLRSKTVFDNVYFPLKLTSLSRMERENKVRELLALVGLSDKENAYPSQLSGGQKQRVAIARALASDPEILLCDEATSALDPQTTDEVLKLLKKLNQTLGLTILIITHEMQVVKDICNKVAVMENGEIIERGSIVEVFSAPKMPLTRSFINTATQIDSALEKVLAHKSILHLQPQDILARVTYVGESTSRPIIATLQNNFNVTTNILSGSIEFLQDIPVGSLVVSFSGNAENKKQALEFLKGTNIRVEIIDQNLEHLSLKRSEDDIKHSEDVGQRRSGSDLPTQEKEGDTLIFARSLPIGGSQ
ncbi:MAG: ATP-binding cassette domain-containing protein [Peptostreptococcaceae bacterium]|nr:ATP-binding cassette domain-containing protein [Peptostreptococcaceae bacterium]